MGFDKSTEVEAIAETLCTKFGSRKWYEFYCKAAYKLPEASIWKNYEKATTSKNVQNPGRLFYWLCTKEMNRAG